MHASDFFRIDHVPERNPLTIALMVVTTFRLAVLAFQQAPLPGSLQAANDLGQVSATVLWLGALATTLGLLWPSRRYGLGIEFLGVMWFAAGLAFWGFAVLYASSEDHARIAATLAFGIAIGCLARAAQIYLFVRHRGKAAPRRTG